MNKGKSLLTACLLLNVMIISGCSLFGSSKGSTAETSSNGLNAASSTNHPSTNASTSNEIASAPSNQPASTENNSSNSNTDAGDDPSNSSGGARPFPPIIRMAMGQLSEEIQNEAMVPTVSPQDPSGSNSIFYETKESHTAGMGFPGFQFNYHVQLNSTKDKLADYSGTKFDTAAHALASFDNSAGNVAHSEGNQSTVDIGYGHKGELTVNSQSQSASIYWSEGRWQIRVTESHSTVPPIESAKQVVGYLESNFMPIPQDKAAILVTINKDQEQVSTIWQEQNFIYSVNTYFPCPNPIDTALAMAISMKPYR